MSTLERYKELRELGYITIEQAADRLGVKPQSLRDAIRKARRAGDTSLPKPQVIGDDLNTSTMAHSSVKLTDAEKGWAARVIAGFPTVTTANDLAQLLDACGITAQQGKEWGRNGRPRLLEKRK